MQPLQCYSITGQHGGSLVVSVRSLHDPLRDDPRSWRAR